MTERDMQKAALRGEPSYVWRAGQQRRLDMIAQAAGSRIDGLVLENGCGVGMYVEKLTSLALPKKHRDDVSSVEGMKDNWGEEPWDWLQKELQDDKENDVQDGVLLPRYWRDSRFGVNRRHAPVVGVSWYEASAYCNWLLQNWDGLDEGKQGLLKPKRIRLPLETEWAQAAGGEEKDRYAFGELKDVKEITRYANTSESNINRTTSVWMYPQGKSPAGAIGLFPNNVKVRGNSKDQRKGQ
jgi:hypothetical protein